MDMLSKATAHPKPCNGSSSSCSEWQRKNGSFCLAVELLQVWNSIKLPPSFWSLRQMSAPALTSIYETIATKGGRFGKVGYFQDERRNEI